MDKVLTEAEHAGFATSLVGTRWESSGGPPTGNRWQVVASDGRRVQVVNTETGLRYWWDYQSIVAVAGMQQI